MKIGDFMRASAVLELVRPHNCVLAGLAVLAGVVVAAGEAHSLQIALAFAAAFAICGAGNAINDYCDRKIDAINRPWRPIPSRRLKVSEALKISRGLFIVGIVLAALVNLPCLGLAALNSVVLVVYSGELKRRGLVGNLAIGFLVGSTFLFGGLVVGELLAVGILAVMAGLSTVGRELIKDIQDMRGDRAIGLVTFPLQHGKRATAALATVFISAAIALAPVPYALGLFSMLAYLTPVTVAVAFFIASAVVILENRKVWATKRASLGCKIGMGLGLLAFLAGAIV